MDKMDQLDKMDQPKPVETPKKGDNLSPIARLAATLQDSLTKANNANARGAFGANNQAADTACQANNQAADSACQANNAGTKLIFDSYVQQKGGQSAAGLLETMQSNPEIASLSQEFNSSQMSQGSNSAAMKGDLDTIVEDSKPSPRRGNASRETAFSLAASTGATKDASAKPFSTDAARAFSFGNVASLQRSHGTGVASLPNRAGTGGSAHRCLKQRRRLRPRKTLWITRARVTVSKNRSHHFGIKRPQPQRLRRRQLRRPQLFLLD